MKKCSVSKEELQELFNIKYGDLATTGWSPKLRYQYGYYQANDMYEAYLTKIINKDTRWIDIGGGRALFPSNAPLSKKLAEKCKKLVAVDPSNNVFENPYAHEKYNVLFENYETEDKYDLATFRMVAEHIDDPEAVLNKLNDILVSGGHVIIYTINKYCPIPLITYITPFSLHYNIKKFFWGGEEQDTFPVAYKMNTRNELKSIFENNGFNEVSFSYLDDLSTFARFKLLSKLELKLWKVTSKLGMRYPEHNLLGHYQKQ